MRVSHKDFFFSHGVIAFEARRPIALVEVKNYSQLFDVTSFSICVYCNTIHLANDYSSLEIMNTFWHIADQKALTVYKICRFSNIVSGMRKNFQEHHERNRIFKQYSNLNILYAKYFVCIVYTFLQLSISHKCMKSVFLITVSKQ